MATMKKLLQKLGKPGLIISILVMIGLTVATAQIFSDLYGQLTWTTVIAPKGSGAADTSSTIDVSPYVGKVVFIQSIANATGTSITFTSKIQHSTDGSTWTSAPTDSAFTNFVSASTTNTGEVQYKALNTRSVKRYLRYITTMSAADTVRYGVLMVSQARNR